MAGRADVELKGDLLVFTWEGDLNKELADAQMGKAEKLMANAPKNLRVFYDSRKIGKVGMEDAMYYREWISKQIAPKVVKGVAVTRDSFVAFLAKIAFALSANHKAYFPDQYDEAMKWVNS